MAMEIFKLVGSIFVDNEKANDSIQKTDSKAQGVGKTLLDGIGTAAKWSAGLVAGAGAIAGGVTALATSAASTADDIDKMSQKIGLTKEGYQEWSYIMGQNGMDVDKLQSGIKTLVTQMDSAASGGEKASGMFQELGVSIYDSNGAMKDQETMMEDTLYALAEMENGTEKAKMAYELFGKSGSEMLPMLNQGADGMKDLKERAHELGLIMGDETVDAGVKLGDTMDDIKKSFSAAGTKLGGALIPVVQKIADMILKYMPQILGLFENLAPVLVGLLDGLLPPLFELAKQIFPILMNLLTTLMPIFTQIIQAIMPPIVNLLKMLLPPIIEIVSTLLPLLMEMIVPILALLDPIIQLLQPILDLIIGLLDPIASLIKDLLTPLIGVITKVIEFAIVPLSAGFEFLSGIISATLTMALDAIKSRFDMVKGIFDGLIDFIKNVFTGNWKGAWEGIVKIFDSIWNGIKDMFKIPINWVIDGINSFISGINKIKIPDWVPAVGGKGFSIGKIPRLENGAVLEKGQVGFLEGNGAEAVVPLEKNKKWISNVAKDMDAVMGGQSGNAIFAILTDILTRLDDLIEMGIFLDTGALVGGIAKPMDRKLGQLAVQKARG